MMGIGGGKGLHLTGSLAELTTYVSRWQAVTLNAPPVAYASMSDENPSIAIDWLKTACDKLVNIADWVLPIKESYSIAAGSDYDTGQRLTWTQRTLRGVTAVATAIVAVKVGRIAVKAGARVLGWVVETRAGKVVKKVVKRLAQPIADRLEKRAFNKLVKKAGLKYLGNEVWESPAGLLYTVDESGRFQNRIYHVLAHAEKDLSGKVTHTVFACPKDQILPLIDEAWSLRMTTNPIKQGERTVYNIAMERAIGTTGETNIKLVVEGNKLKTAFPTKGSA